MPATLRSMAVATLYKTDYTQHYTEDTEVLDTHVLSPSLGM